MELIVAVALLSLFGAWWIARARASPKVEQAEKQQAEAEYSSNFATPLTDVQSERKPPQDASAPAEPQRDRPFAEIADPNGGVREISADEVTAYFQPIRTKLASLRKVAANSTRVAKAFAQSGGATPNLETYRRAHRDAVALTAEIEGLLDIILFEAEADSNRYDELLERVIDAETELEESLESISRTEAQIASGVFLPVQSIRTAKPKTHPAEL
jgi:cytoskeletal protein RodZ